MSTPLQPTYTNPAVMGPPRRTPSNAHIPATMHARQSPQSNSPKQQRSQRHRPQSSQTSISTSNITTQPAPPETNPGLGMSLVSRYNYNLKVLRRRDPSIVTIFDQFSHVCIYHHNGNNWEKQGFEGSMFLYERDSYPPYGFYILNRVGSGDYVQRLYPEDNITSHGNYLMIRCYPDFTEQRLAAARKRSAGAELPKFSDALFVPGLDELTPEQKGRSQVLGLWMFATEAREPMIDVMLRLHTYIKQNKTYPEDYRYGPDRPPPPNPHPRTSSTSPDQHRSPVTTPSKQSDADHESLSSHSTMPNASCSAPTHQNGTPSAGSSELDKLFSKIAPNTFAAVSSNGNTQQQQPQSTATLSVQSLFTGFGAADPTSPSADEVPLLAPISAITGLDLLNSIFASAGPAKPTHTNQPRLQSSHIAQDSLQQNIYSPTPVTSQLPQVLNQDVISGLMGLPSRAASAASTRHTSHSARSAHSRNSGHSHPSSREGDNESEGEDEGDVSQSDLDRSHPHLNPGVGRVGKKLSVPEFRLGLTGDYDRINGDVTPRAPASGVGVNGTQWTRSIGGLNGSTAGPVRPHSSVGISKPVPLDHTLSSSTIRGGTTSLSPEPERARRVDLDLPRVPTTAPSSFPSSPSPSRVPPTTQTLYSTPPPASAASSSASMPNHRPLVPFEPDSDLWPYPRAPLDDRSQSAEDDIVELDFEDTSALSDPDQWKKKTQPHGDGLSSGQNQAGGNKNGRGVPSQPTTSEGERVNANGKGKKKGKKDRVREAIERSWDVPASIAAKASVPPVPPINPKLAAEHAALLAMPIPPPASPSPPPAVPGSAAYLKEFDTGRRLRVEGQPRVVASEDECDLSGVRRNDNSGWGQTETRVQAQVAPQYQSQPQSPPMVNGQHAVFKNGGFTPVSTTSTSRAVTPSAPSSLPGTSRSSSSMSRVKVNGAPPVVGLDPSLARESVVAVASDRFSGKPPMERNKFVSELLLLVHTDKSFVDTLWKEYLDRVGA
ncbi:hypothetical protein BDN72DRAFT_831759 [Pluteus cervinus]|uniref:Uncharacterized protein n=1 Tax=Pluteus cervinus TaxID=181527 RepID=A0ACD3BBH4_9AGAR|nr:hypothetical protein BDN72DRAFT_831759 [Pluteus cervinus]